MNWRRFYATIQIGFVISLMATASSCLYMVVAVWISRKIFELNESFALLWIGLPVFIILLVIHIRLLPKPLRKAGMLSDEPEKFGPWFKQDPKP